MIKKVIICLALFSTLCIVKAQENLTKNRKITNIIRLNEESNELLFKLINKDNSLYGVYKNNLSSKIRFGNPECKMNFSIKIFETNTNKEVFENYITNYKGSCLNGSYILLPKEEKKYKLPINLLQKYSLKKNTLYTAKVTYSGNYRTKDTLRINKGMIVSLNFRVQ